MTQHTLTIPFPLETFAILASYTIFLIVIYKVVRLFFAKVTRLISVLLQIAIVAVACSIVYHYSLCKLSQYALSHEIHVFDSVLPLVHTATNSTSEGTSLPDIHFDLGKAISDPLELMVRYLVRGVGFGVAQGMRFGVSMLSERSMN